MFFERICEAKKSHIGFKYDLNAALTSQDATYLRVNRNCDNNHEIRNKYEQCIRKEKSFQYHDISAISAENQKSFDGNSENVVSPLRMNSTEPANFKTTPSHQVDRWKAGEKMRYLNSSFSQPCRAFRREARNDGGPSEVLNALRFWF